MILRIRFPVNRIIVNHSFASTPDFPSRGRDFSGEKSLMKLPVAVSKLWKGKIRCGGFKTSIHLVANPNTSHSPGTARCLSKLLFSPEDILGMPSSEGYFSERKQGVVSVRSGMRGIG